MPNRLDSVIDFIASQQESDGSFLSTSLPKDTTSPEYTYKTTFLTSLIVKALAGCDTAKAQDIKERAVEYLLTQRTTKGSWNYWDKEQVEYSTLPYPDDLDDTFCALIALHSAQPSAINGKILAETVKLLTFAEAEPGGPYRTWLTPTKKSNWQDVDLVVTSNIMYFLQQRDIELPSLSRVIDTHLDKQDISSPYYPTQHAVLYFLSRVATPKQKKRLLPIALALAEDNQLNQILKAIALKNLGCPTSRLKQLTDTVDSEVWQLCGFCNDPMRNNQPYIMTSRALTAAFYIEMMSMITLPPTSTNARTTASNKSSVFLKQRFTVLPRALRNYVHTLFKERLRDGEMLAALPYHFQDAIGVKRVTQAQLTKLSAATLCGWLAYTIYDDFLDNEGIEKQLPVANIVLRESIELYAEQLGPYAPYRRWMDDVFDRLEAANYWEVTHCRFNATDKKVDTRLLSRLAKPEMPPLSDRSLGHLLSPLAILAYSDYALKDEAVKATIQFFEAYLTARQLSDDAHDWKDDLRRGQINSVSRQLIRSATLTDGPIEAIIEQLDKLFWQTHIIKLIEQIDRQLTTAQQAIAQQAVFQKPEILLELLKPIEHANERTRNEYREARAFIANYGQGSTLRN